jgi:hypothetical protein
VAVDSKTYLVRVKIVNRVEMPKEGISDQKEIGVLAWEFTFVNNEVAFAGVSGEQVLFRL